MNVNHDSLSVNCKCESNLVERYRELGGNRERSASSEDKCQGVLLKEEGTDYMSPT